MIIAVDTGGTKTLVASFSKEGNLRTSKKFATPLSEENYVEELTKTINEIASNDEIDIISVALPGRVSNGVMLAAGNLNWKNFDLAKKLKKSFNVPILVENDANLAGLSEARELENPVPVCLYVTISTGIGTGIITDNQIDRHFSQSEGGQVRLNYRGRIMRWEKFASGRSIHRTYHKFARSITSKLIWQRIAKNISRGFIVLLPTLRPDMVIIGGSIGTYFKHYNKYLEKEIAKYFNNPSKIIAAKRPEEAVIYGCYQYAKDALANKAA